MPTSALGTSINVCRLPKEIPMDETHVFVIQIPQNKFKIVYSVILVNSDEMAGTILSLINENIPDEN